jgi:hypothetical protein
MQYLILSVFLSLVFLWKVVNAEPAATLLGGVANEFERLGFTYSFGRLRVYLV